MTEIVSFDAEKATRYVANALLSYLGDPPDSDYQRGFLGALLVLYTEGLGKGVGDDRIKLLQEMADQ
jgi:hypothetical protein